MKTQRRARRAILAALGLALAVSRPAMAGFEAGDFHPTITGDLIYGNERNDDNQIAAVRFGLVHYFRNHLGFISEAAFFRPSGTREEREVDTSALGLVFGLRWHFLNRPRYGLYAEWASGFLVARDPYPPEGTEFNGTSYFGAGTRLELGRTLTLLAGLRQVHVSNGKGLVEANPSFDGIGGYLGMAFRPRFRAPFPPLGDELPYGGGRLRWRAEATYEVLDDDDSRGGGWAVDFPLTRGAGLWLQVSGTAAELVGETIWKGSIRTYRETQSGRTVAGYSRQEFSVFTSDIYEFQIERSLDDVATATGLVAYEEKNLADDRVFGGLFITVYPASFAAINTGVGFERRQKEFFDSIDNLNDAGFNIGGEIGPGFLSRIGASAFFNVGIGYDTKIAGIRFQPGAGESLIERHRRGGLMMVR